MSLPSTLLSMSTEPTTTSSATTAVVAPPPVVEPETTTTRLEVEFPAVVVTEKNKDAVEEAAVVDEQPGQFVRYF